MVRRRSSTLLTALVAALVLLWATPVLAFHFPWDQGHDTFDPENPRDGDNPPDEENRDCGGDPVDLGSGNLYYFDTRHDLLIPAPGPDLSLLFAYHSRDRFQGPFGDGWHVSLLSTAIAVTDGAENVVIIRQGDGKRKRFVHLADGTFESPPGLFQTLVANADGSLTLTSRDGMVEDFNPAGRLVRVTDRNGNAMTIAYDATGMVTQATDSVGRSLTFVKGPNGRVASVADPMGRVWSYGYDLAGNLTTVTDPLGNATAYTYDASGNLLTATDPRGTLVMRNVYDADDRVVRQDIPGGSFYFTYLNATTTLVRDPRGNTTRHEFNDCGNPTREVDPLGRVTQRVYDPDFNLTRAIDGRGNATDFGYDAQGNLVTAKDALGNTTTIAYEPAFNQVASVTNANGNATTFTYDAKGNLIRREDAAGNAMQWTFDARGLPLTVSDGLQNQTHYEYDQYGNLTKVTDALGQVTQFDYDLVGNVVRSIDAEGRQTLVDYDALNRPTRVVDAQSGETLYSYDADGNVVAIEDARGRVTQLSYDPLNRIAGIQDPLGNSSSVTYDANGNMVSLRNKSGETITFQYDAANQLIQKVLPGGRVTTFSYDAAGNRTSITTPDSALSWTYDAADRVASTSTAGSPYQPAVTLTYQYDPIGLLVGRTDPTGTTTYAYDALNRVTSIGRGGGNQVDLAYDPLGRVTRLDRGNGMSTLRQFDGIGQLVAMSHELAGTALVQFAYSHDAVGNRLSQNQDLGSTQLASLLTYDYDSLDRVTGATSPLVGEAAESFTYDSVGNRLRSTGAASDFVYDDDDRLLEDLAWTYSYDAEGRLATKTSKMTGEVSSYLYDAENLLTEVRRGGVTVATYRYDGLGRRIEKSVGGALTRYVYDEDAILFEYAGSGNTLVARYTHGHATDQPLVMERDLDASGTFEPGEAFFYLTDGLGSIAALADTTGAIVRRYAYDAFGDLVWEDGTLDSPYGYAARELDRESGLYYNRARYYDPASGRFLSEDRIALRGGTHAYAYASNNPINTIDPFGLDCTPPWGGGAAANAAGGSATGFGGGLEYATRYQNNPTAGGFARLGRPGGGRFGWDRSFHIDFDPRYGSHFNAEFGPLREFNHAPLPSWANRVASTSALRNVARGAVVAGLALDAYDILTAKPCDRPRAIGGAVGGWGGAWAGAAIGSAIAPGIGTVIGGLIGGLVGSLGGQWLGSCF